MVLGVLDVTTFTIIHVAISLVAILAGLVVMYGFVTNQSWKTLIDTFLSFTLLTTVSGFLFPLTSVTPAVITGIVALIVLLPTLAGIYFYKLKGSWRAVYLVGAVISLYLNCFVLVVQAFQKIGPLHVLAPQGTEPAFSIAQGIVLLFFIVSGYLAVKRFRPTVFS